MNFPDISPVAFEIGPLVIRWYALAYVAGILIAQYVILKLDDRRPVPLLSPPARDNLIVYGVLGIILGGRLGYILFYNLSYYVTHPAQIFHVWQGGMSFHGGLIGVTLAFYLFAKKYQLRWLSLMDIIAVAAPIGLFLGRCANFVNGELYGRTTDVPWAVIFPASGPVARHPSQLYEAVLEGLLLFIILWRMATKTHALEKPGTLAGMFIAGYGIARFIVEFFREPDVQLGLLTGGLSMGQLLCIPMIGLGLWVMQQAR